MPYWQDKLDEENLELVKVPRKCDYRGCETIVTHWVQTKGYEGPVYCLTHAYLSVMPK